MTNRKLKLQKRNHIKKCNWNQWHRHRMKPIGHFSRQWWSFAPPSHAVTHHVSRCESEESPTSSRPSALHCKRVNVQLSTFDTKPFALYWHLNLSPPWRRKRVSYVDTESTSLQNHFQIQWWDGSVFNFVPLSPCFGIVICRFIEWWSLQVKCSDIMWKCLTWKTEQCHNLEESLSAVKSQVHSIETTEIT